VQFTARVSASISTFIKLCHLSLNDIRRSSFESILNSSSSINSLIRFSIHFSNEDRAAYTFTGVPEGAFYDRIFHLFPSLRKCHLLFWRDMFPTLDSQFILPVGSTFIPVKNSLRNLQILTIRCAQRFLLHLFEHLPQLVQLNYIQTNPWLLNNRPLQDRIHK
jgi:hypothetical protein